MSQKPAGSGILKSVRGIARPYALDVSMLRLSKFEILQPKLDGWYAEGTVSEGMMVLRSSTGANLVDFEVHSYDYLGGNRPITFRGEYLYGTNRAKQDEHTYLTYWLYDVILQGPYVERYRFLQRWHTDYMEFCNVLQRQPEIWLTPTYDGEGLSYLYEEVKSGRLEGIIGRDLDQGVMDMVHRYKPKFCVDYILIGVEEGQGRLTEHAGALLGGQIKNGRVEMICKVAGMNDNLRRDIWVYPDKYIGKVFEAESSQVFESGALRHPRFRRWRLDVDPNTVFWSGSNGRFAD